MHHSPAQPLPHDDDRAAVCFLQLSTKTSFANKRRLQSMISNMDTTTGSTPLVTLYGAVESPKYNEPVSEQKEKAYGDYTKCTLLFYQCLQKSCVQRASLVRQMV
jgi:hypothetical protein